MLRKHTFILLLLFAFTAKGYNQNLFISADSDCNFMLDGIIEGQLKTEEKYETTMPMGKHTIVAKTLDSYLNFRREFTIENTSNIKISFNEQLEHIEKEKQKAEDRNRKIAYYKTRKQDIIKEISKNMVLLEGGEFNMGSTDGEEDEQPVRQVTVNSFYISKYELTQKQWMAIMEENPSHFHDCENCPVERVHWYDAVLFCNTLSRLSGLEPYYIIDQENQDTTIHNIYDHLKWTVSVREGANGYRLPYEAEWEYAVKKTKGDAQYKYSGGNNVDKVAWTLENSNGKTHPVGQKLPNKNGLYDMSGNVWEWCNDWYSADYYEKGEISNPKGASTGWVRVIRGGGWLSHQMHATTTNRDREGTDNPTAFTGLRIVKNK